MNTGTTTSLSTGVNNGVSNLSASSIGLIAGLSAGVSLVMAIAGFFAFREIRRRRAIFKTFATPLIQNEEQLHSYIQTAFTNLRTENLMRTQIEAQLRTISNIEFCASREQNKDM